VRILFLGLNYAPEPISTGVYTTGLCEELVARGHEVRAVVGKPYYPEWRVYESFRGGGARISEENGVRITRVPHYVPHNPTGPRRITHHASFALSALLPMLREARVMKPDLVMTVAPSLLSATVARLVAAVSGARSWLHIQDFEVEASFATGLLDSNGMVARLARGFERSVLRGFDRVSSISFEMCRKAEAMIGSTSEVVEFRNWAEIDHVRPLDRPSTFRQRWGIGTPHVALYSGNIARKQGIEILVEVARILHHRTDLTFVICGQGPNREKLESLAQNLSNVRFHDLQPAGELNELLGLATIHLLPQKADAADLVLPSKLTNMLASGRPVVATAAAGTGLAREVDGCGLITPPGDPVRLAAAIEEILDDPARHATLGEEARRRAEQSWNRDTILSRLCERLEVETSSRPRRRLSREPGKSSIAATERARGRK
jgi:colanic acid biosynthesis glycosyl transferase WcaI